MTSDLLQTSRSTAAMSPAISRQAIVDGTRARLEELAETACNAFLKSWPQFGPDQLQFIWKFDHYPGFPSSAYNSIDPVPKDISAWTDYDLDTCNSALLHNLISIKVSFSNPRVTPAPVNIKEKKDYRSLRTRIRDLVESTIGREVYQRTGHPINYIKSDPDPPNCFRWVFSDEYPEFPYSALSEFRMEDVEECEEALDKDYLKVVRTDVRNANPTREWRDTAIRSVREKVLRLIEKETGLLESVEDVPEILTQRSIIMDGLAWELGDRYQFPFGQLNPNPNKLQLTNWSNAELEGILRAMETGDMKLVRVDANVVNHGFRGERIPRRKDRPRRLPRDPRASHETVSSNDSSPSVTGNDDNTKLHHPRNDAAHTGNQVLTWADHEGNGDFSFVKLLEQGLFERRKALQKAQEEIRQLRAQIKARDSEIKRLIMQHQKDIEQLAGGVRIVNDTRDVIVDRATPRPGSSVPPVTTTLGLQEKERKNIERIMDMVDRQRELEKQLAAKSSEVEEARQAGFDEGQKRGREEAHRQSACAVPSPTAHTSSDMNDDSSYYESDTSIRDSEGISTESLDHTVEPQLHRELSLHPESPSSSTPSGTILPSNTAEREFARPPTGNYYPTRARPNPGADTSPKDYFSPEFLNQLTGGSWQLFSSPKDGLGLGKTAVGWQRLITINSTYQERAPKATGDNGTVVVVDGEPYCSDCSGIYPTLISSPTSKAYSYIGNYDVTSSSLVSVETWKTWPPTIQREFAKNVLITKWGNNILRKKNLLFEIRSDAQEDKIDEVLGFFSRASPPNLRMRSLSLHHAFFSAPDYEDICTAWVIFISRADGRDARDMISRTLNAPSHPSQEILGWRSFGGSTEQLSLKRKVMHESPQQMANKRQRES